MDSLKFIRKVRKNTVHKVNMRNYHQSSHKQELTDIYWSPLLRFLKSLATFAPYIM